jgi:hypothetical protein
VIVSGIALPGMGFAIRLLVKKCIMEKTEKNKILILILSAVLVAALIRIPQLFGFDAGASFFYEKNAALIVFLGIALYVILTAETLRKNHLIATLIFYAVCTVYINLLHANINKDVMQLVYLHLPLLLWCFYGLVFIGFDRKDKGKRMAYIQYNGKMAILGAVLMIAGFILSAVTMGLFSAIDMNIENFYMEYIAMTGVAIAPIAVTYIIEKYPRITHKIIPLVANIFSPLVTIIQIVFLTVMFVTAKSPFNDREFLMVINALLAVVTALVVFSITGTAAEKTQRFLPVMLFALTAVTLITNLVALSAIIYRLGEFGLTPNRTAVLGINLLIFVHLVLMAIDLFKTVSGKREIQRVERTTARYLPVYALWTLIVVFLFPWIFATS